MERIIEFTVNGEKKSVKVLSTKKLLNFIREDLKLIGTKCGCDAGECGSCTVIVNGITVNSCMMYAVELDNCNLITIEGESIIYGKNGNLSDLQKSFIENSGLQCGFCTPGMIMAARGLLIKNRNPNKDEIIEALGGNLCRCTGYEAIIESVEKVIK